LLHLPPPTTATALEGPTARAHAAALATVAAAFVARLAPPTILVVGGDTAVHLLQQLRMRRLQVLCELLPGMPLTSGLTEAGQAYQLILKAGNHGDETTLAQLWKLIDRGEAVDNPH
jgi:uncharacterized protein YgbK (DUF1537 family)